MNHLHIAMDTDVCFYHLESGALVLGNGTIGK